MTDNLAASRGHASPTRGIALLLPGMSMNATIFPDLGMPTVVGSFNAFDGRADKAVRAVGRSGAQAIAWSPVMQAYIEEVERIIRTPVWATAGRRIVVGHSFGGMLALAWLAQRGTAGVHGLLLIGTAAGPMYDVARLRLVGSGDRALRLPIGPLMPLWDSALVTWMVKRVLGGREDGDDVDFRRYAGKSDLAMGIAGWRVTTTGAKRSFRAAMHGFDVRDRLARVDLPTVVLHGTRDSYFAPAVARALADGLPRGELRLVDGAGHVLPVSHPDEVAAAVHDLR